MKLVKKLIFQYKRPGFFEIQIAIISVTKIDAMLISLSPTKVEENKAIARTFTRLVLDFKKI